MCCRFLSKQLVELDSYLLKFPNILCAITEKVVPIALARIAVIFLNESELLAFAK